MKGFASECKLYMYGSLQGITGRIWPDRDVGINLRKARLKTVIGNLTNAFESGMWTGEGLSR
jgi:hypothetical protein